jgi:hypothetical protein
VHGTVQNMQHISAWNCSEYAAYQCMGLFRICSISVHGTVQNMQHISAWNFSEYAAYQCMELLRICSISEYAVNQTFYKTVFKFTRHETEYIYNISHIYVLFFKFVYAILKIVKEYVYSFLLVCLECSIAWQTVFWGTRYFA